MAEPKLNANATAETIAAELPTESARMTPGGVTIAGRYEVLGLIGSGGMGRVYRVRDHELDEIVALKVLHRDLLGSEGMVSRFRQEVKLARRVTHRNVARTFDIGEHEGERFLTMELVDGEPLDGMIARLGGLGQKAAIGIAKQICAGMAAAHAAGIIHRDLKPENVLIARDGRVVITDFGIARTHLAGLGGNAEGAAGRTSGQAVGTPAYMAPEQVEARADIDARADIYAFGALLYEALTGDRAWPGESPYAVAMARILQPPPDPRERRADLPAPLASLVVRCLARHREARFASAELLGLALEALEQPAGLASKTAVTMDLPAVPTLPRREKSVAVLTFRNIGPPEDAYLAEGLSEDLLDALSTVKGLRVRARGMGAISTDLVEEGRKLGVDVVVDGSVRRAGELLRVSARLVGAQDGFQIWASRFERHVSAALALNDDVARAIATALSTDADLPSRAAFTDTVALDLYLRGRHELSRFWMGDQPRALAFLKEALERAPDDPTILSAYATTHMRTAFLRAEPLGGLEALVARALERAPLQGEPWCALSMLRWNAYDDPAGATRAAKRALVNAPSLAEANDQAGRLLLEGGQVEEAKALLERALWLDESMPWARIDLMRIAAYEGDWERANELASARQDLGWIAQIRVSLHRFALWRGQLGELPQTGQTHGVDKRTTDVLALMREVMRTGALPSFALPLLRSTIDGLPPRARGRILLSQMSAELHAFAGVHDGARAYTELAVAAGLLDRLWIDRQPLLEPYRKESWFVAARELVVARSELIVSAWKGPPEELSVATPAR